ncbi:MAG TPA: hypothetical protein VEU96_12315 [Bryobacteraceae bacterium]|nr:hypothetical protein [Bryobacteraceae bacterium]
MKLFRNLGGALSLALLLGLLVSSVPAGAQTLTALSLERSLALNNILTTITPQGIPAAALAAIAAGALDVREQVNFNPQLNTLGSTVFVVPTGAPNPTNLSQLPFTSFVASTTMAIDRIYIKSNNTVLFVGSIIQSTNTPYGNYLGATSDFSFGYSADKPPKISNVIETVAGTIVLYSASSSGTFTIVQPSSGGGGGGGGVSIVVNGVSGTTPSFQSAISTIVLDASKSTSTNPGALTYSWAQAAGSPSVSITGGNTAVANVTLAAGKGVTYVLKLTVTDSTGASTVATVSILFI